MKTIDNLSRICYIHCMNSINVVNYITVKNKEPFDEWLQELDLIVRSIIRARIVRIRLGNFGDCKRI